MKKTVTIKITRIMPKQPVTGEYEYSVSINGEDTDEIFDTKENMIGRIITALKYDTDWQEEE